MVLSYFLDILIFILEISKKYGSALSGAKHDAGKPLSSKLIMPCISCP